MAKNCMTEQSAQRQRWIEDGLLELMQRRDHASITVTDLCRHLGLSRRSFYRYFDDLNDMIDSIIDRSFMNLAVAPLRPELEDLQRCFAFWLERRIVLDALFQGGHFERLFRFTLRYTDFAIFDTEGHTLILEEDARIFIVGGFMSLMMSWHLEGFRRSTQEMAQTGFRMLYEPFLRRI